ncbi:MAG: hypothetical protein QXW97_02610 [Candidatus Pacearchaeota archaeon]
MELEKILQEKNELSEIALTYNKDKEYKVKFKEILKEKIKLSEKTALTAGLQCCEDEVVKISHENIIEVLEFAKKEFENNKKFYNDLSKKLDEIKKGLTNNAEFKGLNNQEISILEKKVCEYCPKDEWYLNIGGSPAITTISMYEYSKEDKNVDVFYVGNLVSTTIDALYRNPELIPVFINNKITKAKPRTLCLEDYLGKYRIMITFSEGRELSELQRNSFFKNLQELGTNYKRVLINIGGLNKGEPEEYKNLIEEIRNKVDSNLIYIGTNDFPKDNDKRKKYLEIVLNSDFASMNDVEIKQLYESVNGDKNKKIGEILEDLEEKAKSENIKTNENKILIVHSPNGAILKTYGKYESIPKEKLEEALKFSVIATSYRLASGIYPNKEMIENIASNKIKNLNKEEFEKEFGDESYLKQKKIIGVYSPKLLNIIGDMTGAGATFDGVMMYYLYKIIYIF